MQATLRPMNLGEILDKTFAIYRKNFLLFAGIAALEATAMFALHSADTAWWHLHSLSQSEWWFGTAMSNFVIGLGYFHVSEFIWAMLLPVYVLAASKTIFGRRASIWAAIRFTTSRWSLYLKMAFLILCAELIIPELLAALATLGTLFVLDKMGLLEGSSGFFPVGAIIFAGIVGGLLLFFWITAGIAFAVPAAVLEELSGTRALRRSWELTKGSRWRIVGAWLAVAVLAVLMSLITVLLLRLAVYICYYNWHWRWFNLPVYQQLVNVLNAAITSFLGPVYPIAVTLLYYEQRSRKEGFDVELMLEQAGLGTGDSAAIRILRSTEGEFVEAEESGWSRFMKFIRSLRGFD